ncbi:MAG: SatD family protein [Ignavibacteria bacterium]|jgi:hypothetical protein
MPKNNNKFILMADIIGSRNKESKKLISDFKKLVKNISSNNKDTFLSPLTITLGDEFQSVVKSLSDGINIIFQIEETIIKKEYNFKLRYILYYGPIDTAINKESAYGMLGDGLTKARESLNNLRPAENRILLELQNRKSQTFNMLFFIYSSIIDKWKQSDFKLLTNFFEYGDYKIVAQKMKREKGNTWRKAKTLQIQQYFTTKKLINEIIKL